MIGRALSAAGLVKPSNRNGLCPACRLLLTDDGASEVAAPAVVAAVVLGIAVVGWVISLRQSQSMAMGMGLGTLPSFAMTWVVMMAAMMLPSAVPMVYEYGRRNERRSGWVPAVAVVAVTYIAAWLLFGAACYAAYNAFGMPWPQQRLVGGAVLVVAAAYALTPIKRASEARCRELCALHGPLPFNLMRGALFVGVRYGLSCIGCSGALTVASVLIGMNSVVWMAAVAAFVLIYKLGSAPSLRRSVVLAAALATMGLIYGLLPM